MWGLERIYNLIDRWDVRRSSFVRELRRLSYHVVKSLQPISCEIMSKNYYKDRKESYFFLLTRRGVLIWSKNKI